MRKSLLALLLCLICPSVVHAQGSAPELFGVKEIIIQYPRFSDAKVAETCGLTREQIMATLTKAFVGTGVPAINPVDVKPPVLGVARIDLVPEIYSHADENLDCTSAISLSAENRVNAIIPPVNTLRGVTVVYWHQRTMAASPQTIHAQLINGVLEKMAAQFAQQYKADQPPELPSISSQIK